MGVGLFYLLYGLWDFSWQYLISFILSLMGCIVLIVPVLYFLKWDYKAIFRKPSRRDLLLVVALFAGYMIYSLAIGMVLEQIGIVSSGTVDPTSVGAMKLVITVFNVLGEEFIKFIPFMFLLRVIYKYSNNRKLSVIISVALIMISLHQCTHLTLLCSYLHSLYRALDQYLSFTDTLKLKTSWFHSFVIC
jgi:hypothetical protein